MLALEILAVALPLALFALIARRARSDAGRAEGGPRTAAPPSSQALSLGGAAPGPAGSGLLLLVVSVGLGMLVFVPAWLIERWIDVWAGLDEHARTSDVAGFVYAFFVAAPLEQGLKVAAFVPAWRSRRVASPGAAALHAAAVGLGFVTAHNVQLFSAGGVEPLDAARALLAAPAHLFFAAAWGLALGRQLRQDGPRHIGGRTFGVTWLLAMLFNGIYDHLVFGRGKGALFATAPILLTMAGLAWVALRSLRPRDPAARRPSRFFIAAPSIETVRTALWRTEQPVMIGWIGLGALVTIGVISAALAAAVVLGHRIGVDFGAVDRADGAGSAAPLALLGGSALAAFPVAGYLVSRASASRGVLEAAIAATLAIGGALVVLGLAAPVAVVFVIAFAPVALGLACAGAWIGASR